MSKDEFCCLNTVAKKHQSRRLGGPYQHAGPLFFLADSLPPASLHSSFNPSQEDSQSLTTPTMLVTRLMHQ